MSALVSRKRAIVCSLALGLAACVGCLVRQEREGEQRTWQFEKFGYPTDLMEFARYDLGEVIRKETGAATPRVLRLVVGNPLIMKQLVKAVPDAGSYAPVTILIDERADGVHISYDRMASYLAPYGNAEALKVARDLDAKVEGLLTVAAR